MHTFSLTPFPSMQPRSWPVVNGGGSRYLIRITTERNFLLWRRKGRREGSGSTADRQCPHSISWALASWSAAASDGSACAARALLVRHRLCPVLPLLLWLRHRLCPVLSLPSWLRHRLCPVLPLPSWLRHRLCHAVNNTGNKTTAPAAPPPPVPGRARGTLSVPLSWLRPGTAASQPSRQLPGESPTSGFRLQGD